MKNTIIIILVVVVIGFVIYFFIQNPSNDTAVTPVPDITTTTIPQVTKENKPMEVIGKSVEGRDLTAYHFGTGETELLFIGGIHGGYEWNTALVAYNLVDYLKANPEMVPANLKVTVIPVMNPDGLNKVVGTTTGNFTKANVATSQTTVIAGRFNGNNVDLNRNFDCDWQTTGTWQTKAVSGGDMVFSEPESQAIKNYVEANKPKAVIVWYSAAGGVFASNCHNGVPTETTTLTKKFADASGYPAYESFDFYVTTGDLTNWLAKINIPAISVLLTNHIDTEWTKNLAGVKAILNYYTK